MVAKDFTECKCPQDSVLYKKEKEFETWSGKKARSRQTLSSFGPLQIFPDRAKIRKVCARTPTSVKCAYSTRLIRFRFVKWSNKEAFSAQVEKVVTIR